MSTNGMGKDHGSIMPVETGVAGEAKDYALWFFWTMLHRMPFQPRGNIPIAANITFLEDSLRHYNKTSNISISRLLIKV